MVAPSQVIALALISRHFCPLKRVMLRFNHSTSPAFRLEYVAYHSRKFVRIVPISYITGRVQHLFPHRYPVIPRTRREHNNFI